ncbi:MAG: hypothetical protein R2747_08175 [Pyrinomonadaceae bacterium]
MKLKTKTILRITVGLFGLIWLAAPAFGQGSTRVLLCNEKDTVRDVINFPRQAETFNGKEYAIWRAFIDDEKGTYKLTIWSYSDFEIAISRKSRARNSRWIKASSTSFPTTKTNSTGGKYYAHNFTVNRSGNSKTGGEDFFIAVLPKTPSAVLTATWYTSGCDSSGGAGTGSSSSGPTRPSNPCGWKVDYGVFGMPSGCTCECNGRAASPSKCGPKPKACP